MFLLHNGHSATMHLVAWLDGRVAELQDVGATIIQPVLFFP